MIDESGMEGKIMNAEPDLGEDLVKATPRSIFALHHHATSWLGYGDVKEEKEMSTGEHVLSEVGEDSVDIGQSGALFRHVAPGIQTGRPLADVKVEVDLMVPGQYLEETHSYLARNMSIAMRPNFMSTMSSLISHGSPPRYKQVAEVLCRMSSTNPEPSDRAVALSILHPHEVSLMFREMDKIGMTLDRIDLLSILDDEFKDAVFSYLPLTQLEQYKPAGIAKDLSVLAHDIAEKKEEEEDLNSKMSKSESVSSNNESIFRRKKKTLMKRRHKRELTPEPHI